jgi:predicted nucleotidyltransferase
LNNNRIIVSFASPDQIILFGSYARRDNTDKSDIDLLIVKKGLKNGRKISGSIYMAFLENEIGVPVDWRAGSILASKLVSSLLAGIFICLRLIMIDMSN